MWRGKGKGARVVKGGTNVSEALLEEDKVHEVREKKTRNPPIQLTFIEDLLFARHCGQLWEYNGSKTMLLSRICLFFWPSHMTFRILIPQPGTEPSSGQ